MKRRKNLGNESCYGLLKDKTLYSVDYNLINKRIQYKGIYYKVTSYKMHAYLAEYSLKKYRLLRPKSYIKLVDIGYDYDRVKVILAGDKPGIDYNVEYKGKILHV